MKKRRAYRNAAFPPEGGPPRGPRGGGRAFLSRLRRSTFTPPWVSSRRASLVEARPGMSTRRVGRWRGASAGSCARDVVRALPSRTTRVKWSSAARRRLLAVRAGHDEPREGELRLQRLAVGQRRTPDEPVPVRQLVSGAHRPPELLLGGRASGMLLPTEELIFCAVPGERARRRQHDLGFEAVRLHHLRPVRRL